MAYDPMRFFAIPTVILFSVTLILGLRFLYYYSIGNGSGHIQSLILALAIFVLGIALLIVGLLSDLIAVNRQLLEGLDHRLRTLESLLDEQTSVPAHHRKVFNRAVLTFARKLEKPQALSNSLSGQNKRGASV